MDEEATPCTPRENPRTRRVRSLIMSTAIDVLLECGAQEVTAACIAERAEVARTTVYRHWPDQRSLLLGAIEALTTPHEVSEPSGPLADDVRNELERLRQRMIHRDVRKVFGALAAHAAQDEAFSDAQRLFVKQLTQPMVVAIEAAKRRGELDAGVDAEFEATLLAGPLLHQYLALHDELSDELLHEVAERWLNRSSTG